MHILVLNFILFFHSDVTSLVDQVLSILQMSNSFANCFIYSKMHHHLHHRSTSTATFVYTDIEIKQISGGSVLSSPITRDASPTIRRASSTSRDFI